MRTGSEDQITLVLIRHGETAANKEHRYLGRTEEALSREGVEKLMSDKKGKRYPKVDILFSSPMRRCRETAEILYPQVFRIEILKWREMDFGAFEGKNHEELKSDERYQAWIDSNGSLPFPEGESREGFILRCKEGFLEMVRQLCKIEENTGRMPKTVAAIVHGGTIMALLSSFYGGEYFDYQVPNGSGYVCRLTETAGEWKFGEVQRL